MHQDLMETHFHPSHSTPTGILITNQNKKEEAYLLAKKHLKSQYETF